jgi:hypothetical protein
MIITINTRKKGLIKAIIALCQAFGEQVETDIEERLDQGLAIAMQESDPNETVPTEVFLEGLKKRVEVK